MPLSAITLDSTGQVVEWGETLPRAATADETEHNGTILDATQSVIDTNTPRFTKVVGTSFTVMTGPEQDAVVLSEGSENDAEALEALYDLLDRQSQHDYGDKSGAFTIDMSNGNGLEQKFTLEGSLDTDDITITLPGGPRRVCVQIDQDGTGGWDIPTDAWPGTLEWGSKGAPTFGDAAGSVRFIVFHHVDGVLRGHYDTNVF